jgi:hypothetical protein
VKRVEALPVEWAPGEKWDYRNTNYLLLGIIIHKITGKPYAEFLSERIFKPLGMTSTRPISDRDIIPNRAAGYEVDRNDELKNQEWVSPTFNSTADGTLYFNVLDLAKWDEALYGTKLLKQSSLDRSWTVYPLNDGKPNPAAYGFGWFIIAQNGHKLIEHGGGWQGFTCRISRYPDDGLTVVVLTNLEAGYSNPREIGHVVAGLVDPALTVPELKAIPDDHPELVGRLKKFLDELLVGTDIGPEITPQLAARMTPDAAKGMQQRIGKLSRRYPHSREAREGGRGRARGDLLVPPEQRRRCHAPAVRRSRRRENHDLRRVAESQVRMSSQAIACTERHVRDEAASQRTLALPRNGVVSPAGQAVTASAWRTFNRFLLRYQRPRAERMREKRAVTPSAMIVQTKNAPLVLPILLPRLYLCHSCGSKGRAIQASTQAE